MYIGWDSDEGMVDCGSFLYEVRTVRDQVVAECLFVRLFQEKSVRPCLGTRDFVFDADMSVFGRELGERA